MKGFAWILAAIIASVTMAGCTESIDGSFESPTSQISANENQGYNNPEVHVDHGSIVLKDFAIGQEVEIRSDKDSLQRSIQVTSANQTIGFLEPSTRYSISFDGTVVNITTSSHPWKWSEPDNARIRPGEGIWAPNDENFGPCTISALARDATAESWYAVTAGHCVEWKEIGDEVLIGDHPATLVAYEFHGRNDTLRDWALVMLERDSLMDANPVTYAVGGSTGLMDVSDMIIDDIYCHDGQGRTQTPTPDMFCSRFKGHSDFAAGLMFQGRIQAGDSGMPLIHQETGMVAGFAIAGVEGLFEAVSMCHALSFMEEFGFELKLAHGTYPEPPEDLLTPPPGIGNPWSFEEPISTCPQHIIERHAR